MLRLRSSYCVLSLILLNLSSRPIVVPSYKPFGENTTAWTGLVYPSVSHPPVLSSRLTVVQSNRQVRRRAVPPLGRMPLPGPSYCVLSPLILLILPSRPIAVPSYEPFGENTTARTRASMPFHLPYFLSCLRISQSYRIIVRFGGER